MKILLVGPVRVNFPHAAELSFKKGLEQAGCTVETLDPNIPDQHVPNDCDAVLVFKNAYGYNDRIRAAAPISILYQPDDARFIHIRKMLGEMREHCDFLLSFDKTSARISKETFGYRLSEEMLLTADPDLYTPVEALVDADFAFVGSLGDPMAHRSRNLMVQALRGQGYRVVTSHEHDPTKVSKVYRSAKVVLNHATDVGQRFGQGYGWQQRHFEVAMTKSCLLSNENDRDELRSWCRFSSPGTLLERARELMSYTTAQRAELGESLYREAIELHSPIVRGRQIMEFISRCA